MACRIYQCRLVQILLFTVLLSAVSAEESQIIEDQLALESKLVEEGGEISTHSQKVEQGRTRGEYRIYLPDNRLQIVSYVADDQGYRATVRYENAQDDYAQPEQTHWGFSSGAHTPPDPVTTEPNVEYRPHRPPYPPPQYLNPESYRPQIIEQDIRDQQSVPPYPGVIQSQVNTFIIHPTPPDRKRPEDDRNPVNYEEEDPAERRPSDERRRPLENYHPQDPRQEDRRPDDMRKPVDDYVEQAPPEGPRNPTIENHFETYRPLPPESHPRGPPSFTQYLPERPIRPHPERPTGPPQRPIELPHRPPPPPSPYLPRPYPEREEQRPIAPQQPPLSDNSPDPPVYVAKETPAKEQDYDSIIYDPKVFHPFFEPDQSQRIPRPNAPNFQPIRPFQLQNPYENRPRPQTPPPRPERPVRPNQQRIEPDLSQPHRFPIAPVHRDKPHQFIQNRPSYQEQKVQPVPQQDEYRPHRPSEPYQPETKPPVHEDESQFIQNRPPYQEQKPVPQQDEYRPSEPHQPETKLPYPVEPQHPEKTSFADATPSRSPFDQVLFYPTKPIEPYEPQPKYPEKPSIPDEPQQRPEPNVPSPERPAPPQFVPQHHQGKYRPQFQQPTRPYENENRVEVRPQRPQYPPLLIQPIRPINLDYFRPIGNYREPNKPHTGYDVPHTGYPPGVPLSGITAIRPILNPKDQPVLRPDDFESLEGEAPTEPPEKPETTTTTTEKPILPNRYKFSQPPQRKPFIIRPRPTNHYNRLPIVFTTESAPSTELPIDEDSPLLKRFKFKNTPNDGFGQRTQPRRKQTSPPSDLLLEEDEQIQTIRTRIRFNNEHFSNNPSVVTKVPEDELLSDLEGFPLIEEELNSTPNNTNDDSDIIFFDDGIIPPLLLRIRDKGPPAVIEKVTLPPSVTESETEIPYTTTTTAATTTTKTPRTIRTRTPPTSKPTTTTTASTTTTTKPTQKPTTTKIVKKKKKRVRTKALKKGNGTQTMMPKKLVEKHQQSSVIVKDDKLPVKTSNLTTITRSSRIRFPPRIRFVQKNADRVTRQNGSHDADLEGSDTVHQSVVGSMDKDMMVDAHVMSDLIETSLNAIPVDQLDLVYESADDTLEE